MKELSKENVLTAIAVVILLFTSYINWNLYSWFTLAAVICILIAWYTHE